MLAEKYRKWDIICTIWVKKYKQKPILTIEKIWAFT